MLRIDELLHEVPAFAEMRPEHLNLIAGCASNCGFADGDYLAREGDAADTFWVLRRGAVALETFLPQGGSLVVETLHEHDLVGWSWLFPPYRTQFDLRAVGVTRATAFDGACIRGKLEEDSELGYELMKRFAQAIIERLQATRLRLLDVYGHAPTG